MRTRPTSRKTTQDFFVARISSVNAIIHLAYQVLAKTNTRLQKHLPWSKSDRQKPWGAVLRWGWAAHARSRDARRHGCHTAYRPHASGGERNGLVSRSESAREFNRSSSRPALQRKRWLLPNRALISAPARTCNPLRSACGRRTEVFLPCRLKLAPSTAKCTPATAPLPLHRNGSVGRDSALAFFAQRRHTGVARPPPRAACDPSTARFIDRQISGQRSCKPPTPKTKPNSARAPPSTPR